MDECGFNFEHVPCKVVCKKGWRSVNARVSNRQNVTVVCCVNAAGRSMPPFLIVKGTTRKSLHTFEVRDGPLGTRYSWQQNAWIEDALTPKWSHDIVMNQMGDRTSGRC